VNRKVSPCGWPNRSVDVELVFADWVPALKISCLSRHGRACSGHPRL
jgi:hypothetical protein